VYHLLKVAPGCGGCFSYKVMNLSDGAKHLHKIAADVKKYGNSVFPGMAGKKALQFIDGNFRNQSWEGIPWKRRRGGKRNKGRALLIDRGILRRGNKFAAGAGTVRVYNDVRYAAVNNNGFNGSVSIPAHTRRLYGKFKTSSLKTRKARLTKQERGSADVKAHTRNMRIPRRQFMPTELRPSPTLNRTIRREVELQMHKILKRT
jgi:hypothetical protein